MWSYVWGGGRLHEMRVGVEGRWLWKGCAEVFGKVGAMREMHGKRAEWIIVGRADILIVSEKVKHISMKSVCMNMFILHTFPIRMYLSFAPHADGEWSIIFMHFSTIPNCIVLSSYICLMMITIIIKYNNNKINNNLFYFEYQQYKHNAWQ